MPIEFRKSSKRIFSNFRYFDISIKFLRDWDRGIPEKFPECDRRGGLEYARRSHNEIFFIPILITQFFHVPNTQRYFIS